jgi:hypothetical protein
MLVRKTHQSIVLGSITFPRDKLQLNLTCFHTVVKKDVATAWMLVGGQWFLSHLQQFDPGKGTLVSAE